MIKRTLIVSIALLSICSCIAQEFTVKSESLHDSHQTIGLLAVGIGKYQSKTLPELAYAVSDVINIYATIQCDSPALLSNEVASKASILMHMKKTLENDIAFLYFTGHGKDGSLITIDNKKITQDELVHIMATSKAKTIIALFDSCYNKWLANSSLLRSKNIIIYSSSGESGISLESHILKSGVFTWYLTKALNYEADRNTDGILTVYEVYSYLYVNIREYTNETQSPTLFISDESLLEVALPLRPKQ